jgi:hypothetical protein
MHSLISARLVFTKNVGIFIRLLNFRHSFDVLRGWRAPTVARKENYHFSLFKILLLSEFFF